MAFLVGWLEARGKKKGAPGGGKTAIFSYIWVYFCPDNFRIYDIRFAIYVIQSVITSKAIGKSPMDVV
jgi:hypothetical protein